MSRLAVAVLAGAFGVLGWPSPAETCSPPQPGFDRIFPVEGTLLPRNAHVFARGTGHPGPVEAEMFEVDFVVSLPVTTIAGSPFSSFHLTTIAEFAAGLPIRVSYTDGVDQISAQYQVSAQEDLQPPGPVLPYVTGTETRVSEPGLCEPGGDYLKVFVPEVLDDWGLLFLRVVRDDGRTIASRFPPGPSLEGLDIDIRASDKSFCYRIHARDMGGNESISNLLCWPSDADAGGTDSATDDDVGRSDTATPVDSAVDAAVVDAGPQTGDVGGGSLVRDSGCGCRSTGKGSAMLWLMLFGMVFALRRRGGFRGVVWFLAALLILVGGILPEGIRSAEACTPLPGSVVDMAPLAGARVPANGRAFALTTEFWPTTVEVSQNGLPSPVRPDVRRGRYISIVTTLEDAVPGELTVSYDLDPPEEDGVSSTRLVKDVAEDTTPPGEFSVELLSVAEDVHLGGCSSRRGQVATLRFESPQDDWGVLYFDLHDELALYLGSTVAEANGTQQAQVELREGRDCITVTAVDFGGNRSSAEEVCREGGCRCTGAGFSSPLLLGLAFLVAALRRRSRL